MPLFESNLLSKFPVLRVSDPKIAEQRLRSAFGATRVRVRRGKSEFLLRANNLQMSKLGMSYVATTGEVSANFPPATCVRQVFVGSGNGMVTIGRLSEPLSPGLWSSVLPAGEEGTISFGPDYAHLVLRIEYEALLGYLRALLGDDQVTTELEFSTRSIDNSAMHALKLRVMQFATDYNARGVYFSSVANAEVERMMIMKFLLCHRHTYSDLLLREPVPASSSAVRIAAEYIEANWDKPIDIARLAAVANVGIRSLFRKFRQEREQSPIEFIKSIRLHKALVMLENPEAATSVTQVALKCGFNNSGRFAQEYRTRFGELPSKTLTRARTPTEARRIEANE